MSVLTGSSSSAAVRPSTGMVAALRVGLTWPIVSLLVTGTWHFTIEAISPDLRNAFVPAVIGPILLAYGAWAGNRTAAAGAGIVGAIVAGTTLGMLPLALDVVGFGVILGRGFDAGLLAGIFGLSMVAFGALLGGGYAMARAAS